MESLKAIRAGQVAAQILEDGAGEEGLETYLSSFRLNDVSMENVAPAAWRAQKALTNCGYQKLGAGYYSIVLAHSAVPNHAIKIGFKRTVDGGYYWAQYSKLIRAAGLPEAVHLPDVQHLEDVGTGYLEVLPRYNEALVVQYERGAGLQAAYTRPVEDLLEEFSAYRDAAKLQLAGKKVADYLRRMVGISRAAPPATLSAALGRFGKVFDGCTGDMHAGNFMVADDNTLILTDPLGYVPRRMNMGEVLETLKEGLCIH